MHYAAMRGHIFAFETFGRIIEHLWSINWLSIPSFRIDVDNLLSIADCDGQTIGNCAVCYERHSGAIGVVDAVQGTLARVRHLMHIAATAYLLHHDDDKAVDFSDAQFEEVSRLDATALGLLRDKLVVQEDNGNELQTDSSILSNIFISHARFGHFRILRFLLSCTFFTDECDVTNFRDSSGRSVVDLAIKGSYYQLAWLDRLIWDPDDFDVTVEKELLKWDMHFFQCASRYLGIDLNNAWNIRHKKSRNKSFKKFNLLKVYQTGDKYEKLRPRGDQRTIEHLIFHCGVRPPTVAHVLSLGDMHMCKWYFQWRIDVYRALSRGGSTQRAIPRDVVLTIQSFVFDDYDSEESSILAAVISQPIKQGCNLEVEKKLYLSQW